MDSLIMKFLTNQLKGTVAIILCIHILFRRGGIPIPIVSHVRWFLLPPASDSEVSGELSVAAQTAQAALREVCDAMSECSPHIWVYFPLHPLRVFVIFRFVTPKIVFCNSEIQNLQF